MTIKQKFSSIDQSKLTADQKAFLTKIKDVTKNFTDAEMNKKVEAPLDGFIAKAKEKMPEAIKSAPVKRTGKAKTSETRKPKRTAMSLAKEIRKEGESWKDAQARASKMMKEDSKDLSKTVETELDKLSKLVKSQKERKKLSGLSGTNIRRDSARKAKPQGRRISKNGKVYYENRDNRTDRLAPNYPKNAPFLEDGGYLTDPNFGSFQNQVLANGGSVTNERKHVNKAEDYEVRYAKPRPQRKGYRGVRAFELGGTMATDLAGHTGGGDAGLNAGMPLDGFSNTGYTGLVGETGAMSSGEMFMAGGSLSSKFDLAGFKRIGMFETLNEAKNFTKIERKDNPDFDTVVIKDNDRTSNPFVVFSKLKKGQYVGNRVYELGGGLPSGSEQSYMITESFGNPAQHFAKGGGVRQVGNREYSYGRNWTNDHRHVNKAEDHEVKYNRKGKFLGVFEGGGAIKNQYEGKSADEVWKDWNYDQKYHFLSDHREKIGFEEDLYKESKRTTKPKKSSMGTDIGFMYIDIDKIINTKNFYELPRYVKFELLDHVRTGQYNKGGAVTNERKHVNHDEDYEVRYAKPRPSRKGYKQTRKFMAGGMNENTPRIYVADLEAYNNGRLEGEWLDLSDYNNADELMDAIQDVLKKSGGEEYAIHDVEYIPSSMYSEYMGKRDFEELYEMMELAKDNDLPLEVVQEIVSQYSTSAVDDFYGKFDNAEDFAYQQVEEFGLENFNNPEYYVYITETDRRLLSQEMADSYVDDIRNEDGGNRLIEEAGMNVDEYEEADSETQEEMLDKAREIVYDEYYDTWFEGLQDPYYFLVEEQGLYSKEDFFKSNFALVDYDRLAFDLEQDYTFVYSDGDLYVFNIR